MVAAVRFALLLPKKALDSGLPTQLEQVRRTDAGPFAQALCKGLTRRRIAFKGYSDDEIGAIASLYGIEIDGQLRDFLREIGRSDGGLIGEHHIHLYKPHWDKSTHREFQQCFVEKLKQAGLQQYDQKPFVFSFWEERLWYFVRTGAKDPTVYQYDDEDRTVAKVDDDLLQFLRWIVRENRGEISPSFEGDLLSELAPARHGVRALRSAPLP